jgi:hypothetical protein
MSPVVDRNVVGASRYLLKVRGHTTSHKAASFCVMFFVIALCGMVHHAVFALPDERFVARLM